MRRTQIYITDEQERGIARRAADGGVPKAAVIRRLLDDGLGLDDGVESRRSAILATAGVASAEEDWPEWLAAVRGGGAAERLARLER